MGRKKTWDDCRNARDFCSLAERRGARVVNGGRHVKIQYQGYSVPVPAHGEIKPGTRASIIRSLVKIGLAATLLGAFFGGLAFWLAQVM